MFEDNLLTQILNIEYPIIQGGMLWLADAVLAAAVSEAGGLGTLSPLAGMKVGQDPARHFADQIQLTRERTRRPFAVNIPLDLEYAGVLIDVALTHKVKFVVTAAGDPFWYSELLHRFGVYIIHVVGSLRQAKRAVQAGASAIVVQGIEAAAHHSKDELPLFSLLPQVVDAVDVPVIAAGGIVDGRGMAAAFCLGAQGVQMGTRFVVSEECLAHPNYKNAILNAGDADTVIVCRRLTPTRSLKTKFTSRLLALDNQGASAEEIRQTLGHARPRRAQIDGDLDEGEAYAGSSSGLIKDILPAGDIVLRTAHQCARILGIS